jgi:hypothetical protein
MNYLAILLAITIVILIYVLYSYFTATTNTLVTSADLNASNPPITKISNPKNAAYSYSVWLFVNSWNNTNYKIIFSRDKNIYLYLDKTTATLYCSIWMTNSQWNTVTVTKNFPLQNWSYITISIDGTFLDAYLNGKLILSTRLQDVNNNFPAKPPDVNTAIYLGYNSGSSIPEKITTSGTWDASIAGFTRTTSAVDPTTVWNMYLKGNGQSQITALSSYGVNMNVLQNNVVQGTYTIV